MSDYEYGNLSPLGSFGSGWEQDDDGPVDLFDYEDDEYDYGGKAGNEFSFERENEYEFEEEEEREEDGDKEEEEEEEEEEKRVIMTRRRSGKEKSWSLMTDPMNPSWNTVEFDVRTDFEIDMPQSTATILPPAAEDVKVPSWKMLPATESTDYDMEADYEDDLTHSQIVDLHMPKELEEKRTFIRNSIIAKHGKGHHLATKMKEANELFQDPHFVQSMRDSYKANIPREIDCMWNPDDSPDYISTNKTPKEQETMYNKAIEELIKAQKGHSTEDKTLGRRLTRRARRRIAVEDDSEHQWTFVRRVKKSAPTTVHFRIIPQKELDQEPDSPKSRGFPDDYVPRRRRRSAHQHTPESPLPSTPKAEPIQKRMRLRSETKEPEPPKPERRLTAHGTKIRVNARPKPPPPKAPVFNPDIFKILHKLERKDREDSVTAKHEKLIEDRKRALKDRGEKLDKERSRIELEREEHKEHMTKLRFEQQILELQLAEERQRKEMRELEKYRVEQERFKHEELKEKRRITQMQRLLQQQRASNGERMPASPPTPDEKMDISKPLLPPIHTLTSRQQPMKGLPSINAMPLVVLNAETNSDAVVLPTSNSMPAMPSQLRSMSIAQEHQNVQSKLLEQRRQRQSPKKVQSSLVVIKSSPLNSADAEILSVTSETDHEEKRIKLRRPTKPAKQKKEAEPEEEEEEEEEETAAKRNLICSKRRNVAFIRNPTNEAEPQLQPPPPRSARRKSVKAETEDSEKEVSFFSRRLNIM